MKQIIYVASPDSYQIYVWELCTFYQTLKLIQVISTPGKAQPMSIHPNKKFLYVGIRPNFKILTYKIDNSGLLLYYENIKIFHSPTYLMNNKQGTFLYCASYQHNVISVFPINKFNIPETSIQDIKNLSGCHAVNTDEYEKLFWIPCLKQNIIRVFETDTCGILRSISSMLVYTNCKSGPRHIVFHNTNHYAYLINELNSTVNVIKYDCLQKTANIIQMLYIIPRKIRNIGCCWGADIHITPDNNWLYCSDRATSIISCFQISNITKKLKFIRYQSTEMQPRGFAIDATGKFLIIAGQKSNYITLYKVNFYNGKLNFLSRYYSGIGPMWINIMELN